MNGSSEYIFTWLRRLQLKVRKQESYAEPNGIHRRDVRVLPVGRPFTRHPGIEFRSFELPHATEAKADGNRGRTAVPPLHGPGGVRRFYVPAATECVRDQRLELHLTLRRGRRYSCTRTRLVLGTESRPSSAEYPGKQRRPRARPATSDRQPWRSLPVGNTKVGPMPQPNPVSLGLGQLERNRSKSCMSANSVTVELPRDVADSLYDKSRPDDLLEGKERERLYR